MLLEIWRSKIVIQRNSDGKLPRTGRYLSNQIND